jgi:transcriptional regulator with XRE-family HTH domain
MINLFKLHDNTKDRGAYSWIVGNGPELFNNFEFLINQITEKSNYTVKDLSKKISKRIGCSTSMLYDILNGRTEWISLALISELLTILRELGTDEETTKLKSKFLDSIKFLKSAPRSSVKIQAVKKLSPELAEFCGIHAADGSLNLQISIETLRRERINKIKRELNNKFPKLRISRVYKRENKYRIFFNVTDKTRTKIFNYLNRYNINFTTSYKLEFIDLDKNSMEYLRKLIFILFGYYIKIKPREK